MGDGEFPEHRLAFRGHLDQHFAVVVDVAVAADEAQRRQPVHEADHRMVFELKLPREGADRGESVGGQPLDGEQELVLLGLQAGRAGFGLAEHEEAADEVAEPRQVPIVGFAEPGGLRPHGAVNYIVLRYTVNGGRTRPTVLENIRSPIPV